MAVLLRGVNAAPGCAGFSLVWVVKEHQLSILNLQTARRFHPVLLQDDVLATAVHIHTAGIRCLRVAGEARERAVSHNGDQQFFGGIGKAVYHVFVDGLTEVVEALL